MKKIRAKFNSVCAATGAKIKKGDEMYYDYSARKCYSLASQKDQPADNDLALLVQAQEDAYFDNFCYYNNI